MDMAILGIMADGSRGWTLVQALSAGRGGRHRLPCGLVTAYAPKTQTISRYEQPRQLGVLHAAVERVGEQRAVLHVLHAWRRREEEAHAQEETAA